MKTTILAILFITTSFITALSAQRIEGRLNMSDTTQVHQLTLIDGSLITGRLITMHVETWDFKCNNKVESIATNRISTLKVLDKGKTQGSNNVVIEPANLTNSGNSEVIASPTAIPLKYGEAYYETVWGYYNYVECGIGKGVSIGAGGAFPLLSTRLRWGMPIKKNVYIGLCASNYTSPLIYFPSNGSIGLAIGTLGIVSANLTLGRSNRFLNIGAGTSYIFSVGYNGGFLSESARPVLSVGGAFPIGKRFAFLSDNIILPYLSGTNRLILPSVAIRYFKKNIRLDFGLWGMAAIEPNRSSSNNSSSTITRPLLPYLSFGVKI